MTKNTYRSVVNYLKKELSVEYPVYVRRVQMPKNCMGDCYFDEEQQYFIIRIERKIPYLWAVDVVIHEISHVASWHSKDKDDHGNQWGIAYSKVYRTLMKYWGYDEQKVAKYRP